MTIRPHLEHGKIYFYLGIRCALNIFKEGIYEFLFLFLFSFFPDAPRVEMALGKSISPGSIYEGGDVYFDCLVIASPKPKKILWFQDVSKQPTLHSQNEAKSLFEVAILYFTRILQQARYQTCNVNISLNFSLICRTEFRIWLFDWTASRKFLEKINRSGHICLIPFLWFPLIN